MESRIDRFRKLAAVFAATECKPGNSVRRHNAAAQEMRQIVKEPGAAEELATLLDEPDAGQWLAFELLELCKPSIAVREECMAIIERLAAGSGTNALGARVWLHDFKSRVTEEEVAPECGDIM